MYGRWFLQEICIAIEKYMIKSKNRKHRNKLNRINDAKIMIILLLFHLGGFSFKHYYKEYVCKHLNGMFPQCVSYNRFVELEKEVLLPLTIFIKKVLLGNCTGKWSMAWCFGFKLHLIINDKGEILNLMFTPGNVDDRRQKVYDNKEYYITEG